MSRAWNDKKISAHHAIIPTTVSPKLEELSDKEQKLYLLVAKAYLAQFYPPQEFLSTKISIESNGEVFQGSGKVILVNGWKDLYHGDIATEEHEDENSKLPSAMQSDAVKNEKASIVAKQTKPPKRFTPATLIEAMKKIYRYVKDKDLAAQLKECSGIGTEATRASIIETIQKHGFVRTEKKNLVPTEKGYMLLKLLPDSITYPDITARWEKNLEAISNRTMKLEAFFEEQQNFFQQMLDAAKAKEIVPAHDIPKCPTCGKPMKKIKSKKNGKFYWVCSDRECKTIFSDKNGKPDMTSSRNASTKPDPNAPKCPTCGKPMRRIQSRKNNNFYWVCSDRECKTIFNDVKGKPDFKNGK